MVSQHLFSLTTCKTVSQTVWDTKNGMKNVTWVFSGFPCKNIEVNMELENSLKFLVVCNLPTIMGIFVEASIQTKFLVDFSIVFQFLIFILI